LLYKKKHNVYNNKIGNIENLNLENIQLLKELLETKNQLIEILQKREFDN
jgi:hypothetical protein